MLKHKCLKGIVMVAVAILMVLITACSPAVPAATQNEETASLSAELSPPPPEDPFAYDPSKPFNEKEISVEETETGVKIYEMAYDAYDKAINSAGTMKFYLVEPKGDGPFPFVLYFHWLGSPNGNKKEFLDEAVSMAEKGVGGFLIDGFFPWKGLPNSDAQRDASRIVYQVTELRRAVDFIESLPYADAERIGYVGHDYGAMFGAVLSGVDRRIGSYVFVAGMGDFAHWFLMYWVHLTGDEKQEYVDAISWLDPVNHVIKAAPAELFFQFAENDTYISKETADTFYEAASKPKEVKFYDSDHSMINGEAQTDRDDWLLERLK